MYSPSEVDVVATEVVPVAMSAVTIVPLPPFESVITTSRLEKSIGLSLIISPSASVLELSVAFNIILPAPVSSANIIWPIASVLDASVPLRINWSPNSSVDNLPPPSSSRSINCEPAFSFSLYLSIKRLSPTSASWPIIVSSKNIAPLLSSSKITSVSFLPTTPSSKLMFAILGPWSVESNITAPPSLSTVVTYWLVLTWLPAPSAFDA